VQLNNDKEFQMSQERRIWATNRVKFWCMKAGERYKFILNPVVHFDIHSKRLNGTATGTSKINLNPTVMEKVGEEFDQTIGHEVMHLVVNKLRELNHGYVLIFDDANRAHGGLWKRIMQEMGLEVSRCSTYDTELLVNPGDHIYACKCRETIIISTQIHNKMAAGQKRFCRACKGNLTYKGRHRD
jgi:predicted SprT family Zn-dependent metalloprotease